MPIRPDQVAAKKGTTIPAQVFEAFDEMLVEKWRDGVAVIQLDEVVTRILAKDTGITRNQLFDNGWLDVEPAYEEAGWRVVYDKPGYNETYAATFTFTAKRR